ncbi:unnamed protein product [Diplocarpon coronariae]
MALLTMGLVTTSHYGPLQLLQDHYPAYHEVPLALLYLYLQLPHSLDLRRQSWKLERVLRASMWHGRKSEDYR